VRSHQILSRESEHQALPLKGNAKALLKMLSGETGDGIFKSIEWYQKGISEGKDTEHGS